MESTPLSLLERLRQVNHPSARADWDRLAELFAPLLYQWARRHGLQEHDAAELVQDVFVKLLKELPGYDHQGKHSFRAWLRKLLLNLWRDQRRKADPAAPLLDDPAGPDPRADQDDAEYRVFLAQQALQMMQRDFDATTWRACWETKVRGRPTAEVAAELGLTGAAVHAATYRVLKRLREELRGFFE